MIYTKILGKVDDENFKNRPVDYIDFEWHETYSKLHRKTSRSGRDVALSLDDSILKIGIKPGDVFGVDSDGSVIAADVLETDILSVRLENPNFFSTAKVAYEIGNCHAPLFAGKDEHELITIFNEPMQKLFEELHGIKAKVERRNEKLDFSKQISSIVGHGHGHSHGH
ncbi:MAG TPA: urease accessory protein UreE [Treponema sp.]|nr:urease accessory protein UreE [Treponema sp.]